MQKTEKYYQQKIAEEIRRILELEQNKEAAEKFWQTLSSIKPNKCMVKYGAREGEEISFTLAFDKQGKEMPIEAFFNNIPDASFIYGILFGLAPDIFHYNPRYTVSDEDYTYMKCKLLRNG